MDLFVSRAGQFQEADMELYGKKEHVRYYSIDLLWGQKLYQELRFVPAEINDSRTIPASTSLTLEPVSSFLIVKTFNSQVIREGNLLKKLLKSIEKKKL